MSNSLSTTTARNPQSAIGAPAPVGHLQSPRPPSARDLEIYKRVKLKGIEQWEVAVDLGLTPGRVSQVMKRVTRWLAVGGDPLDPLIRDHVARNHIARADLKLRLSRAIELAMIALEFHPPLTMTRRRYHGMTEVWREETTRDVGRNHPSAIRLMIDAVKTLRQLEEDINPQRERGTDASASNLSDEDLLRAVFDFLCGCRSRAESTSRLPAAESVPLLIATTLTTVLGLPADQLASYVPSAQPPNDQTSQNAHLALTVSASTSSSNDASPNDISSSIDSGETPPS